MSESDVDPTRIVADADVLVADLFVGGAARDCLDAIRRHSWLDLVASDQLLYDAETVVETLSSPTLAESWRACIDEERISVEHPSEDHPGLASAYRGGAAHLLTFDDRLTSSVANLSIQSRTSLSIRTPDAFASLFDPERYYEAIADEAYPGPDRDYS